MFGPIDLPSYSRLIISDISKGTDGEIKNDLLSLSPIKHMGDF